MESNKRMVVCPYCKTEQNPLNIPLKMTTDTAWTAHDCEKCGRTFGYVQVVRRSFTTVELEGQ